MSQVSTTKSTLISCVNDIIKELGLAGLYAEFIPIWLRFGRLLVCNWLFMIKLIIILDDHQYQTKPNFIRFNRIE